MRHRRRRPRTGGRLLPTVAIGSAAVVGGSLVAVALSDGGRDADARTTGGGRSTVLTSVADTYVVRERPTQGHGDARKITASVWPEWNTEAYVAFDVPEGAPRIRGARVVVTFEQAVHRPEKIELRTLPTSWDERETSWQNRPEKGRVVATVTARGDRVVFDVGSVIDGPGRYAFAITNPGSRSAASLHARESGRKGPRLILDTRGRFRFRPPARPTPPPTPPVVTLPEEPEAPVATAAPVSPRPAPTRTRTPRPTTSPSAPPSVSPRPSAPPKPGGKTMCGVSLELRNGESYESALRRADSDYGGLETVRLFYRGVPPAWPGKPDLGKRPPIISFKFAPKDVLAGRHDAAMAKWFATAPRDRDVYWVYYHEPEDNVAKGEFTAADYRAAWRRLRSLADRADNPRLKATLVLMGWSLTAESRRNWRDYYAGKDVVQVLGWDVYNLSHHKGRYDSPSVMFDKVIAVSNDEGLPFGIAETGSYLIAGDRGGQRAGWLRESNAYLQKHGALWSAYFDLDWPTGDFRLLDPAGQKAWRDSC
ncbi:DUF7594 domain-containing protein [Actinomadura flavalba]|uniref:CBM96 family carbohydrate-binding protein n=1 Tax=Actinomadura flavalba TaxID=1120938 RepID=UPI0004775E6A|nr:DNRLRE domain-containing protein [Actinomadura flavalba]